MQQLYDYGDIPQELISAAVRSNQTRKDFMAQYIMNLAGAAGNAGKDFDPSEECEKSGSSDTSGAEKTIGIYRLTMKSGSDDFRQSSILGIIRRLVDRNYTVVIYEPLLKDQEEYCGCRVIHDLHYFMKLRMRPPEKFITNGFPMD